jgi:hypothetical protein
MVFDIVLWIVFVLGATAFLAVIVKGIVDRIRHRTPEEWQDDLPEGRFKLRGGPSWTGGGPGSPH